MTTNYHTPITTGASANAANINAPLAELDAAIDAIPAAQIDSESATDGYVLTADGAGGAAWEAASGGDVTGPASSTDNAVARWDGTGGDTLQDSDVTVDDDGNIITGGVYINSEITAVTDGLATDYGYNLTPVISPATLPLAGTAGELDDDFYQVNDGGGSTGAIWSAVTGCVPQFWAVTDSWLRFSSNRSSDGTPSHGIMQATISGHSSGNYYYCRFFPNSLAESYVVGFIIMSSDWKNGQAWWLTTNSTNKTITPSFATYNSSNAWLSQANAKNSNVAYTTDWTTRWAGTAYPVHIMLPQIVSHRQQTTLTGAYIYDPLTMIVLGQVYYAAVNTFTPAYGFLFVEGNKANLIGMKADWTRG